MSQQTTSRPIVVGKKNIANYALAVATRFGEGQRVIMLRARGRFCSAAFDAANKAINLGLPLARGSARWGQETAPGDRPVSWVEIELLAKEA